MDRDEYKGWRDRLIAWLEETTVELVTLTELEDPLHTALVLILNEARHTVMGINTVLPKVKIIDNNQYGTVLSQLEKILTADGYVVAEYSYEVQKKKIPVIRLILDAGGERPCLSLLFFEDTVSWASERSRRLLSFVLMEEGPSPRIPDEGQDVFEAAGHWKDYLREGLCLPIRLMS
jgi:hypothetical protein